MPQSESDAQYDWAQLWVTPQLICASLFLHMLKAGFPMTRLVERPPSGKELFAQFTILTMHNLSFFSFQLFSFLLEGMIWF